MAFEVFAEGYFSTSRQAQARHVWPSNAVPTAVKKKLGLPTPEIGYDGVIDYDHVNRRSTDSAQGREYMAYCVGHMRGILQSIDAQNSTQRVTLS